METTLPAKTYGLYYASTGKPLFEEALWNAKRRLDAINAKMDELGESNPELAQRVVAERQIPGVAYYSGGTGLIFKLLRTNDELYFRSFLQEDMVAARSSFSNHVKVIGGLVEYLGSLQTAAKD